VSAQLPWPLPLISFAGDRERSHFLAANLRLLYHQDFYILEIFAENQIILKAGDKFIHRIEFFIAITQTS
jgi:hypothetical protein